MEPPACSRGRSPRNQPGRWQRRVDRDEPWGPAASRRAPRRMLRWSQPPALEIPEMVDCAVCSAEFTDAVPVIAAWMAVQMAWETFG